MQLLHVDKICTSGKTVQAVAARHRLIAGHSNILSLYLAHSDPIFIHIIPVML
jgi:hypothetical protein